MSDISEDLKRCRFDLLVMPLVDLMACADLSASDKAKVAEAMRVVIREAKDRAAEQRHLQGGLEAAIQGGMLDQRNAGAGSNINWRPA